MIHLPFLLRLHSHTLSKLLDGNYTGLDLFYHVKDCWKKRDTPHDILLKPLDRGLPYKIGQWCFREMSDPENVGASTGIPYYQELSAENLFWFLEDLVEAMIRAGVSSEDELVQRFKAASGQSDKLFERDEAAYFKFIDEFTGEELPTLIQALHDKHNETLLRMEEAYATEISDRIVHDRQLCSFISELLLHIGFDGEDFQGVPQQWVEREAWPAQVKRVIHARDRGKCAACGVDIDHELEAAAHLDHIVPIARGGCNDIVNLQLLCSTCNLRKGRHPSEAKSSVPPYIKRARQR